jgi:WhiB family redox-sensing transcriptional regulator
MTFDEPEFDPPVGDTDWMAAAECRGQTTRHWFPEPGEDSGFADSFCRRCPVAQQCVEYAIDNDLHGQWGGTSKRQRNRIVMHRRREITQSQHGTRSRYVIGCRCDLCKFAEATYQAVYRGFGTTK